MGGMLPAIHSMFDMQNAQQIAFIRSVMKEQRRQELNAIPLESIEAVAFDLETTGFSPYMGDEIISIGAIGVVGPRLSDDHYYSLVKPKKSIPPAVEQLTGITDSMVKDAPEPIVALRAFLEFVQQRILIAHGSGHDKHFLNSALWRTSRVNLSHRLLDTMVIAKWLHPELSSFQLDEMLALYGIPVERRHHALADARMTAQLWCRFLRKMLDRNIRTLGELYAQLGRS
jgi:DNA polymerase-3 subunit epsilon